MAQDEKVNILLKLFNEVDPVGLAAEEAPNEYMPDVKELISMLPNFSDADELAGLVQDVISRYFEGVEI